MILGLLWGMVNLLSVGLMMAGSPEVVSDSDVSVLSVPTSVPWYKQENGYPLPYEFPQTLSLSIPIQNKPVVTPTPTPTSSPVPQPLVRRATPVSPPKESASVDVTGMIEKYGNQYNVDIAMLKKIASCESGYRANAVNGQYGGMYQFSPSTWVSTRNRMGLDHNIDKRFDAEEAIRTAAFKISKDGPGAWPTCSRL